MKFPWIRPNRRAAGGGREFESVSRVASELARTADVEGVARTLLDEIAVMFGVSFAGLTFVSNDASEAVGYLARSGGEDVDWWRELRLDIANIPPADQEQIFRRFYRGADAELRVGAGGTGLGLFIARGLVTAMGGRIWVASREGEGSRFSFELPAPSGGSGE